MQLVIHEDVLSRLKKDKAIKSEPLREARGWHEETFQHSHLHPDDLKIIRETTQDEMKRSNIGPAVLKIHRALIRTLNALVGLDQGKPTTNLKILEEAIRRVVQKLPHGWVFQDDYVLNESVPYLVTQVIYNPPKSRGDDYTPASVHVKGKALRRGEEEDLHVSIYRDDLLRGMSAEQVMAAKGIIPETPELYNTWKEEMERYGELRSKIGLQLVASGSAVRLSASEDVWWSRNHVVQLDTWEGPGRVILDDGEGWGKDEATIVRPSTLGDNEDIDDDEEGKTLQTIRLPEHPILRVFHPRLESFALPHINNVSEYIYDRRAFDRVVIGEDIKEIIDALVVSPKTGDDIITGKGKGVIILSSGPAGVGKTLTAEAYSEKAKRPIYSVQCSQLGLDPEAVEKNLAKFLDRCTRWGAIGLLDEADGFIRERGDDIQQNAIVGVFLRVLEYYRGVLFLTTNRQGLIDDAVLSRCVLHVRFRYPTKEEAMRIWGIMFTQFGICGEEGPDEDLDFPMIFKLVDKFPKISGRTIKQLCRLARVIADRLKKPVTLDLFDRISKFQDVEKTDGPRLTPR